MWDALLQPAPHSRRVLPLHIKEGARIIATLNEPFQIFILRAQVTTPEAGQLDPPSA